MSAFKLWTLAFCKHQCNGPSLGRWRKAYTVLCTTIAEVYSLAIGYNRHLHQVQLYLCRTLSVLLSKVQLPWGLVSITFNSPEASLAATAFWYFDTDFEYYFVTCRQADRAFIMDEIHIESINRPQTNAERSTSCLPTLSKVVSATRGLRFGTPTVDNYHCDLIL